MDESAYIEGQTVYRYLGKGKYSYFSNDDEPDGFVLATGIIKMIDHRSRRLYVRWDDSDSIVDYPLDAGGELLHDSPIDAFRAFRSNMESFISEADQSGRRYRQILEGFILTVPTPKEEP